MLVFNYRIYQNYWCFLISLRAGTHESTFNKFQEILHDSRYVIFKRFFGDTFNIHSFSFCFVLKKETLKVTLDPPSMKKNTLSHSTNIKYEKLSFIKIILIFLCYVHGFFYVSNIVDSYVRVLSTYCAACHYHHRKRFIIFFVFLHSVNDNFWCGSKHWF